ncbi:hypothetical protein CHS0354_023014 [Potamilus streckersoni]|uniref:Cadherin domain-containing protein n=1 Tax=Potamilus streckersoni TaxID=2493646 RepID=A0AAE0SUQ8_9BIVA|nr:hypothetical protein CHS0354_023014 [Potamilus streckersoni]
METAEGLSCLLCFFSYIVNYSRGLQYTVLEEMPNNTFIGNVAVDYNIRMAVGVDEFQNLEYSFLNNEDKYVSLFSIGSTSSNITTNGHIDRETMCEFLFNLNCKVDIQVAAKSTRGTFFRKIEVTVLIADINDNTPIFPFPAVWISIPESNLVGTEVRLDGATDRDSVNNSIKSYELLPAGTPFSINFTINPDRSSTLKIIVDKPLDREVQDNYKIQIVAKDGGTPPRSASVLVNITITDVNDNMPIFSNSIYEVYVKEDITQNSIIFVLTATDLDLGDNGKVSFRLSPYQPLTIQSLFSVDSKTGVIRVIGNLEYIPGEHYSVLVQAVDAGEIPQSSQVTISVYVEDVGNNPPKVKVSLLSSSGTAEVSEFATLGAVVAYVEVIDTDSGRNGMVFCSIISDHYELQRLEEKEYKVIVYAPLDRELQDKYNVTIICEDVGTPPLSSSANFIVNILDANDNAPVFSSYRYTAKLAENNKLRDVLIQVFAYDDDIGLNGKVQYLIPSEYQGSFVVEAETGRVLANTVFDREKVAFYTFRVIAHDEGSPPLSATAIIELTILDVNDNAPVFERNQYEFLVEENRTKEMDVGQVIATDKDLDINGVVTYGILDNDNVPFRILPDGSIKSTSILDREKQSRYDFVATAQDKGTNIKLNSTVRVTVKVSDINDCNPVILEPKDPRTVIYVSSNLVPGTLIFQMMAYDCDEGQNANLSFIIKKRNDSDMFWLEEFSGKMTSAHSLLNSEYEWYSLEVFIFDHGIPQRSTWTMVNISVLSSNVTALASASSPQPSNWLIVVIVTVATVVVAASILVTILVIRRLDKRSQNYVEEEQNDPRSADLDPKYHEENKKNFVATVSVELPPPTSNKPEKLDIISVSDNNNTKIQVKNIGNGDVTRMDTDEGGHLDYTDPSWKRLTALQVQQALLQNNHKDPWMHHTEYPSDHSDVLKQQEDDLSQISLDTETFDSGRGGSVSDGGDLRMMQLLNVVRQTGRRGAPPHKASQQPGNIQINRSETPPPALPPRGKTLEEIQKRLLPMSNGVPKQPSRYQEISAYRNFPQRHMTPKSYLDETTESTIIDNDEESSVEGSYYIDPTHDLEMSSFSRPADIYV